MKRIAVAVDLSEISDLVVARAVELAGPTSAKVRLVRAVPVPPLAPPGIFMPPQFDSVRLAAERSLEPLANRIPHELRDGVVVEFGTPAEVVCNVAREYDADLVVLGAHRYGPLARALGTNAAKIVNRIDRPALVVRPSPGAAKAAVNGERRLAAGEVLRRDHARLEANYEQLLAAYHEGDWDDVRARWDIFEPVLLAHLQAEESQVFPLFRVVDPVETAGLQAEHDQLRALLSSLGVRIDLHAVPADDVEELIRRLRAHGLREEQLHAWMDREMSAHDLRQTSPAA